MCCSQHLPSFHTVCGATQPGAQNALSLHIRQLKPTLKLNKKQNAHRHVTRYEPSLRDLAAPEKSPPLGKVTHQCVEIPANLYWLYHS